MVNIPIYDNTERRNERRVPLRTGITILGRDAYGNPFLEETCTENASKSGACIWTNRELKVGETLKLSARRTKLQPSAFIHVRWVQPYNGATRAGVKFLTELKDWVIVNS